MAVWIQSGFTVARVMLQIFNLYESSSKYNSVTLEDPKKMEENIILAIDSAAFKGSIDDCIASIRAKDKLIRDGQSLTSSDVDALLSTTPPGGIGCQQKFRDLVNGKSQFNIPQKLVLKGQYAAAKKMIVDIIAYDASITGLIVKHHPSKTQYQMQEMKSYLNDVSSANPGAICLEPPNGTTRASEIFKCGEVYDPASDGNTCNMLYPIVFTPSASAMQETNDYIILLIEKWDNVTVIGYGYAESNQYKQNYEVCGISYRSNRWQADINEACRGVKAKKITIEFYEKHQCIKYGDDYISKLKGYTTSCEDKFSMDLRQGSLDPSNLDKTLKNSDIPACKFLVEKYHGTSGTNDASSAFHPLPILLIAFLALFMLIVR